MFQPETTKGSRPPYWVPVISAITGMLSFIGTVNTAWLFSQVPKGDPDQHRELLADVFECFVLSGIVSAFGLFVMLITAPFFFRTLRKLGQGTMSWRIAEYVLFFLHLSPWILAVLRIVSVLKIN